MTTKYLLLLVFIPWCAFAQTVELPKEPVEITADVLEIHQTANMAIFKGNVRVQQTQFTLTSDEMRVYYQPAKDAQNKKSTANVQGQISKIEAQGGVILTADQDKITGKRAVYDAAKQTAVVLENVILTKEKNNIRGERLEYNLTTHQSTITAAKNQRVHGVFMSE